MFKKTMLVFAIVALLVGTLLAQPMRVEGNDDSEITKRENSPRSERMMGENQHHSARRGQGMMDEKDGNRQKGMMDKKGGNHPREMEAGRMIMSMSEELELNTSQMDNIKELQGSLRKVTNTKEAEIKNLLIDKREAMQTQDFKQATKVTKDIHKVKEEIDLAKITTMENIYKVLTKTQLELLKTKCKMK